MSMLTQSLTLVLEYMCLLLYLLHQVADNGRGVQPKDYEALALKYHTSKLSEFNDLEVRKSICGHMGASDWITPILWSIAMGLMAYGVAK